MWGGGVMGENQAAVKAKERLLAKETDGKIYFMHVLKCQAMRGLHFLVRGNSSLSFPVYFQLYGSPA